jgi:hypothetical protein
MPDYRNSTRTRSPYSLHEPMPSHPRAVTWRDVVASALWTIGGSAFVAALLKLGGGW